MLVVGQRDVGGDAVPLRRIAACEAAVEVEGREAVVPAQVAAERAVARQGAGVVDEEHPAEGVEFLFKHHAEGRVQQAVAAAEGLVVEIASGAADELRAFGAAVGGAAVVRGGGPKPEVERGRRIEVIVEIHAEVAVQGAVLAMPFCRDDGRERAVRSQQAAVAARIAAVAVVVAADEEVEAHLLVGPHVIHPRSYLWTAVGVQPEAQQFVALHLGGGDDVDDAVLCVVFRRWVGDDLDALQRAGRERLEVLFQSFGLEVRRLVVYPDAHFSTAAVFDVALGVHLHARSVLERVGGVAALHAGVVADVVEHLLAVG